MLKLAICDDDLSICSHAEQLIEDIDIGGHYTEVFHSAEALTNYLRQGNEHFNIYLLDIEMPGSDGISAARYIRNNDSNAVIIFITSHREYVYDVYDVFEVLPFRFLCKPLEPDLFKKALSDAVRHLRREHQIFFFHIGREQHQLPYGEILYFEGMRRKLCIHTNQGTTACYGQISKLANTLDPSLFVRVHGSYVINLEYIKVIRPAEVILRNCQLVPVSRRYQKALKQAHMNFLKQRGGML